MDGVWRTMAWLVHFDGQPMQTGRFENTAWYQLQLVLNGGQGQMLHNSPVDNNYHPEFIILGNAGQAPELRWTVNGKTVAGSGTLLSPGSFARDDTVLVELTSTAECLTPARSVARATRVAQ